MNSLQGRVGKLEQQHSGEPQFEVVVLLPDLDAVEQERQIEVARHRVGEQGLLIVIRGASPTGGNDGFTAAA